MTSKWTHLFWTAGRQPQIEIRQLGQSRPTSNGLLASSPDDSNHDVNPKSSSQMSTTIIIEEFEPDVFRQLIEYIHTGCVLLQARTLLGKCSSLGLGPLAPAGEASPLGRKADCNPRPLSTTNPFRRSPERRRLLRSRATAPSLSQVRLVLYNGRHRLQSPLDGRTLHPVQVHQVHCAKGLYQLPSRDLPHYHALPTPELTVDQLGPTNPIQTTTIQTMRD